MWKRRKLHDLHLLKCVFVVAINRTDFFYDAFIQKPLFLSFGAHSKNYQENWQKKFYRRWSFQKAASSKGMHFARVPINKIYICCFYLYINLVSYELSFRTLGTLLLFFFSLQCLPSSCLFFPLLRFTLVAQTYLFAFDFLIFRKPSFAFPQLSC